MLSVKGFFMFFMATERSFSLPHPMLTGRATHKAVFVYSGFNAFHCYNIAHIPALVKHC